MSNYVTSLQPSANEALVSIATSYMMTIEVTGLCISEVVASLGTGYCKYSEMDWKNGKGKSSNLIGTAGLLRDFYPQTYRLYSL